LKARGYATGAFVSAVVLDRRYGLARGFDVYDDQIARASEGRSVLESERSCEVTVRQAAAWLKSRTGPFFAWVHFYEPHAPYAPPPAMASAHPGNAYDAEVATADQCLAALLGAARTAEPTSLVTAVTGDHGEGLSDHGESAHGLFLYQSTLSVPMVIAGAGAPPGKRTEALSRSADLAPTLLALLGAPPLTGIDGRDLAAGRGTGEAYAESDYATGFGWAPLRSWRLGDLKLIEAPQPELYDLAKDPLETTNLAATRPADVDRLRGVLRAASASEVRRDERRMSAETAERLRSLGYVAGGPSKTATFGRRDPKDARPLFAEFERALAAEASSDFAGAVTILEALVSKDPENLTFQRSLAGALRRGSRGDESIRVLQRALKMAPTEASLAHELAIGLEERGRVTQAIESEHRALAIDPGFVDALDHLATMLALKGELDQARAAVDRALSVDANHARAWSNRGNIARAQNQPVEAERSYRRAVDLAPDLVDALNGLGVLAVEGGRLEEAAERFTRALELAPGLDEARLNLAVVEHQRGNRGRALELAMETSKSRDPVLRAKALAFRAALQSSPR
jgi:tetratricopeptide (TPR) repeat protein